VNIQILDYVAAFFPFIWGLLVLFRRDLQCWSKLLLCNSLLAIGKGTFGSVTVVPDSIGWSQCKARLGPDALHFFRHEVPSPAESGMFATVTSLLSAEMFGPHHNRIGAGMRFCGDMIYSGHTFFTCLYILGVLQIVREMVKDHPELRPRTGTIIMWSMYAICIAEQCLEFALVIHNRFHYTLDVVMAIVMTLLVFTSSPVCIAAKWWASDKQHAKPAKEAVKDFDRFEKLAKEAKEHGFILIPAEEMRSEADIWLPVFCVPFCCLHGRHHLVSDAIYRKWQALSEDVEARQETEHLA